MISLERSVARRQHVASMLDGAGIPFRFLDAVDGRLGEHPLLQRFQWRKFLLRHGRPAVAGEAGCYASHFLAWETCVALNQPIVVFEDDFRLAPRAREQLALAFSLSEHVDYLRLEGHRGNPALTVWRQGTTRIVRFLKIPQCATCYLITPRAARALIEASQEFVYPVDVFVRHQHLHGVPVYGLEPAPVQAGGALASDIGDRHRDKGPWWCKITKALFKVLNTALNAGRNLRLLARDQRLRRRGLLAMGSAAPRLREG